MELTPEDRQRIYAEERARLEAQDQLKAEKSGRSFAGAGLGCIALIVMAVLAFAFWSRDQTTAEKGPPGAAQSATPGQIRTMRATTICSPTRDGLSLVAKWAARGDREEYMRAVIRTDSVAVAAGTRVKILEIGALAHQIRLLDSDQECWVADGTF